MANCNPNDLVELSNCFMQMPAQQLAAVQTVLLCQILQESKPMASCNPQELLSDAKCFLCLTPFQLQAVNTQLLCEILQGGAATNDSCLVCSDGDPTEDPGCTCALAYNTVSGGFWFWNNTSGHWVPLIV